MYAHIRLSPRVKVEYDGVVQGCVDSEQVVSMSARVHTHSMKLMSVQKHLHFGCMI